MVQQVKGRDDSNPFDFNLDAFKSEVDLSEFVFHWSGKRWTMTHAQALDSWGLIAASAGRELDMIAGMFKVAMGGVQYTEFIRVPLPQYKLLALFDAYMDYCGVDPGELQASTDS